MTVVLDIEASGIDPKDHSILSIGAVEYKNPENTFYGECKIRDDAKIMEEALEVTGFTREQISDPSKQSEEELVRSFIEWWNNIDDSKIIAGQHPHFDAAFVTHASKIYNIDINFGYKFLDQHSLALHSLVKNGMEIPTKDGLYSANSDFVMEYVGIPKEPKPHNALNGALWETEAFGRLLEGKNKLPQFKEHKIPRYLNN